MDNLEILKNLKCPSCEELWPLLAIGMGHDWNGNIVDDASLEVMLRIEKTMQRLAPMGEDDCRYLWIQLEAPLPTENEDGYWEEETDSYGHLWYELMTAHCNDYHYLLLSNRRWRFVDLRSAHHIGEQRDPEGHYLDLRKPLLRLETYVTSLVDAILQDPDAYNDHVERNLPFRKRDGVIQRSVLYDICPIYRRITEPQAFIQMLEQMNKMEPKHFKLMTLRLYMHFWRIAYVAYRTMNDYDPDIPKDYEGLDDAKVFQDSSKGKEIRGLDLDSEDDFLQWEKENSSYHCLDVAYARIHLTPRRDKEGTWRLVLSYNVAGYFQDVLNIVTAFHQRGINLDISDFAEAAIEKLKEQDWITVTPLPNKYREEMSLPYPDDDISQEMIDELIRHIGWIPQARLAPNPQ